MRQGDLMDAAELVSSENKEEIAKGLEVAAGIERESIDFYSKQGEKAQDSELRNFFNFLVGQEEEHLAAISELKNAVQEKGEWIEPKLSKKGFRVFAEKDWDKGQESEVTAILFALWKEKSAEEFYRRAAENTTNEKGREFFQELAEFEKGHAEMLGEFVEESFYSRELIMG